MTVRDSHCFRSHFSHSSAGCLKQFKNYNSPSSHAAFPWPPWLSSGKGFSSSVHEVLRCILSLTSKKYHSESSASKHFVRWNTLSKFLFTSPRLRRVLNTNKQGEYPCQREDKELGSHPCQSKDRFYSLFSQQPGPEELPETMTFPWWVLSIPCCQVVSLIWRPLPSYGYGSLSNPGKELGINTNQQYERCGLPDIAPPRAWFSFSKSTNHDMVRKESDVSKTPHCSKQEAILLFSLQKVLHKTLLIKHLHM